jgi:hypothetical protein
VQQAPTTTQALQFLIQVAAAVVRQVPQARLAQTQETEIQVQVVAQMQPLIVAAVAAVAAQLEETQAATVAVVR